MNAAAEGVEHGAQPVSQNWEWPKSILVPQASGPETGVMR